MRTYNCGGSFLVEAIDPGTFEKQAREEVQRGNTKSSAAVQIWDLGETTTMGERLNPSADPAHLEPEGNCG